MQGGSEGDDVLDLMEVVALLLIPTFLKAARTDTDEIEDEPEEIVELPKTTMVAKALPEGVVTPPPGMLSYVLKMILHDVSCAVLN